MQGSDSFLLELLSASRRRFIIPVYQRNYDWKKANCRIKSGEMDIQNIR